MGKPLGMLDRSLSSFRTFIRAISRFSTCETVNVTLMNSFSTEFFFTVGLSLNCEYTAYAELKKLFRVAGWGDTDIVGKLI